MRVCIATGHDAAYKDLADITFPSVRDYAQKHNYAITYDGDRKESEKDSCKFLMFAEMMRHPAFGPNDVFCWIDTDALVMNSDRRIESIVYEHMPPSVHYLIGTDPNGLNTGFFIARFSLQAFLFMQVANAMSTVSGWADQEGLIQTAVKSPHKDIYKEIPGKVFNCNLYENKGWDFGEYGNYINRYEPGDFVLHLAGTEEPTRSELLRAYAALAR